jgi:hypothetical protein
VTQPLIVSIVVPAVPAAAQVFTDPDVQFTA